MYIIQYNNIYISKIWKLQCRPCSTSIMRLLTGRLLCFSNYLFFNGPKPPRRNKEQKGQQSSVGARPCPCPEGRLHGLCLSFLLLHSFGGKGVDIRLPYLRGFCIPSKQYILYQTYPKQLYPFCLPASSVQPGKYINGILGVRGESNNSCFLKYFLFKNILK